MPDFVLKYPASVRFTTYPDCDICGYPIVTDSSMQKRHSLCQYLYRKEYSKHNQRVLNILAKERKEMDDEQKHRVKVLALHYSREKAAKDEGIQERSEEHLAIVQEEETILSDHPPQPIHVDDGSDEEHWSKQAKRMLGD